MNRHRFRAVGRDNSPFPIRPTLTMTLAAPLRLLAAAGALAALPAFAASQISPLDPAEFDPVNLRMRVDSCAFAPETVNVSAAGSVIRVAHRPNNCFAPGEPRVVDIRLGALPAGRWSVEVHPDGNPDGPYEERVFFSVTPRAQIAVFPAPARPLTDYSGAWYRPAESGWGLSFHQGATNVVFATWYVYDAAGRPTWYVLSDGRWASSTVWSASVYRTAGPAFFGGAFDPALVSVTPVGQATLDFTQRPGEEGWATLSYAVGGDVGAKRITRLAY